jgi:hypothetical protein
VKSDGETYCSEGFLLTVTKNERGCSNCQKTMQEGTICLAQDYTTFEKTFRLFYCYDCSILYLEKESKAIDLLKSRLELYGR